MLSLTLSRVEDPILYCSMWNRGGGGCRGLLLLFVALLTLASSSAGVHIRGKAFHTIVKRRVRDLFPPERMALMNREASAHSLGRVAQIDRERLVDFLTNIFLEVAPYPMKTESKDGDGDEPHGAGDYNPLTGTMNLGQKKDESDLLVARTEDGKKLNLAPITADEGIPWQAAETGEFTLSKKTDTSKLQVGDRIAIMVDTRNKKKRPIFCAAKGVYTIRVAGKANPKQNKVQVTEVIPKQNKGDECELQEIHRAPVESECDTLAQGFTRGCAIKAAMDGGQGVISGGGNAKLSKIHQDCKAVLSEMQRCIFSRT